MFNILQFDKSCSIKYDSITKIIFIDPGIKEKSSEVWKKY